MDLQYFLRAITVLACTVVKFLTCSSDLRPPCAVLRSRVRPLVMRSCWTTIALSLALGFFFLSSLSLPLSFLSSFSSSTPYLSATLFQNFKILAGPIVAAMEQTLLSRERCGQRACPHAATGENDY